MFLQHDRPERLEFYARDDGVAGDLPITSFFVPVVLGMIVVVLLGMGLVSMPLCSTGFSGRRVCSMHDFLSHQEWGGTVGVLRVGSLLLASIVGWWFLRALRDVVPSQLWWIFEPESNRLRVERKRLLAPRTTETYSMADIKSVTLVERSASAKAMYFVSIAFHDLRNGEIRTPDTRDRTRLEQMVAQIERAKTRTHVAPVVIG